MLTHKIRDMFGNSNSGDESRMSGGGHTSDSQSNVNNNQQINFAIKLEKSRSPHFNGENNNSGGSSNNNKDDDDDEMMLKENGIDKDRENADDDDFAYKQEPDLKKWCSKLNEMPENIAAS